MKKYLLAQEASMPENRKTAKNRNRPENPKEIFPHPLPSPSENLKGKSNYISDAQRTKQKQNKSALTLFKQSYDNLSSLKRESLSLDHRL
jgi:hypothetical protein